MTYLNAILESNGHGNQKRITIYKSMMKVTMIYGSKENYSEKDALRRARHGSSGTTTSKELRTTAKGSKEMDINRNIIFSS